jgi:hypothetical protein
MSKKGTNDPEAQWRALRAIARDDMLAPDYPEELLDEELREAGADPDELGRHGEEFVKKLLAEREAALRRKASGTRLRSRSKVSSSLPPSPKTASSLPPVGPKVSSDTGPLDEPD